MLLNRQLAIPLRRKASGLEPIVIEGARGAGKTTLLQQEYPERLYLNLEDASARQKAREDPDGFIRRLRRPAILDEVNRAPELVAYIRKENPQLPLVLVSSVRLDLPMQRLELHRPTLAERQNRNALSLEVIGRFIPARSRHKAEHLEWEPSAAWPEADLRLVEDVRDVDRLLRFAELARTYSGQGLQLQELARAAAVSHRTAVRWIDALERCFLLIKLEPVDATFGRRILKRPKLHFLHGSNNFESEVVSEIYRNARHEGAEPNLKYWRDSNGLEIPLLIEHESIGDRVAVGITPVATPGVEASLQRWMGLAKMEKAAMIVRSLPPFARRESRILRYEAAQL
jgi:predicted AAA+ superfamily ATPase